MLRADGDAAGCRAGGLAAALGDAGFGTPARRGSLSVDFQASVIGRLMRLPGVDPGRPVRCSVRWGEHGYAGAQEAALAALAQSWSEGRVRKKRAPPACERGLKYEGRPRTIQKGHRCD